MLRLCVTAVGLNDSTSLPRRALLKKYICITILVFLIIVFEI